MTEGRNEEKPQLKVQIAEQQLTTKISKLQLEARTEEGELRVCF